VADANSLRAEARGKRKEERGKRKEERDKEAGGELSGFFTELKMRGN
jgi:hypothetical protein